MSDVGAARIDLFGTLRLLGSWWRFSVIELVSLERSGLTIELYLGYKFPTHSCRIQQICLCTDVAYATPLLLAIQVGS